LCAENADGKLDVVDAADPITIEEASVFTQLFDLIDLHGSDGVTSIASFSLYLNQLISQNVLDPDAYKNVTNERLQKLFAIIDPKVAEISVEEDSVTLLTFLTLMNKMPKQSEGSNKAVAAADLHH
jgi:hypothetical protein